MSSLYISLGAVPVGGNIPHTIVARLFFSEFLMIARNRKEFNFSCIVTMEIRVDSEMQYIVGFYTLCVSGISVCIQCNVYLRVYTCVSSGTIGQ